MAYEALVVIGFGVSLAVFSVALFVAHVRHINAPNRTDPSGIVVHIDLGAALAKDEAARIRKAASRRSATGGKLVGGALPGAFALQQNGTGRRRRRPCEQEQQQGSASGDDGGAGEVGEDVVKVDGATSTSENMAAEVWKSGCEVQIPWVGWRWCRSRTGCRPHGRIV